MRNFLKYLGISTLAFLSLGAPVFAQLTSPGVTVRFNPGIPVADSITAVSTDIGAYVQYTGTSAAAATVEVTAGTGDLTFVVDGAAVTEFECPVSGALGGIIDVSNAACDTFTEVASIINASTNWRFVPHAVLGSDTTIDALITLAATDAKLPNGLGLLKDTAVALNVGVVLLPRDAENTALGLTNYVNASTGGSAGRRNKFPLNPFADTSTVMVYAQETITSSGTVGAFKASCVVPKFSSTGKYTEGVTLLHTETGAATTATGKIDEYVNAGGLLCNGGKVVVQIASGTDLTAPTVFATGRRFSQER